MNSVVSINRVLLEHNHIYSFLWCIRFFLCAAIRFMRASPIAQLVKNGLQCRRLQFYSWAGKILGEGIGHPLRYSWTSLVAQLVKNPPAMWKTWVRSLGWEDLLDKGGTTHSSILGRTIPWTI